MIRFLFSVMRAFRANAPVVLIEKQFRGNTRAERC
jgi:hypothetical protein